MQIRGGAIVVERRNHVRVLVEALGTIRGDTARAVARLRIVDPVSPAPYRLRASRIRKAKSRLNIAKVGVHDVALLCAGKNLTACSGDAANAVRSRRVEPVLTVEAVCPRKGDVPPQAQVQGQLGSGLPVLLPIDRKLVVFRRRPILNLVVAPIV